MRWRWVAAGVGAVALLMFVRGRARARAIPSAAGGGVGAYSDVDALAAMLIAETGFSRDREEMAQIVFVALNRARQHGLSPAEVVDPARRAAPVWNAGSLYRDRFETAFGSGRMPGARAFVEQVLQGSYRNMGATSFVHPGGMPAPPCAGNRIATPTWAGTRCLPGWIVDGTRVGGALFA